MQPTLALSQAISLSSLHALLRQVITSFEPAVIQALGETPIVNGRCRGTLALSPGGLRPFAPLEVEVASQRAPAPGDQVEDQYNDCHDDQKMDQCTADVESEAQQL